MRRGWISLLTLALAMLLFASSPLHVYADEPNEQLDMRPDKSSDMGGGQDQPSAPVTTGETQGGREADSYTPPSPPQDPDIVKHSWKNDGQMEQNRGSIEDNRGTIKENFGAIAYNGGTVERHFWSMNTVMSPGDYSISYGDGFRMEKDADGKLRLFLESGTDGIVTILPPDGKVVTKVVFMVNGVEVVLEPLGGGKYKISAPGMPTGPDGFALNEGGIIVLTEDGTDAGAAADREQKFKTFNNWFDGKAPGFAELVALDGQRNGKKGGIRIEGIPEGRSREEVLEELAARPDVRLAMANALLTAAEGGDETLTFITQDGVRVTTSLSALRALLTHFLPVRETIIYKEPAQEEQEIVEKTLEDTNGNDYIQDYTYEKNGLEITIVFRNEEEKRLFEEVEEVYLDEHGHSNGTIHFMSDFEVYCMQIGLDINYYLNHQELITDGTLSKELQNRILLREAGLPNDLLNAVPVKYRQAVLAGLGVGAYDTPEQQRLLARELGEETARELLRRWQEEREKLQEKIKREMRKQDLPLELLDTEKMAKMSYAELQIEFDRIKNATPEQRKEWRQSYEQQLRMKEQSVNRLKQMNMPTDLLDGVPVAAHHSILEKIEKGTLDAAENRWILETYLGKEGAAKLIAEVNQSRTANVLNKLAQFGMPADWQDGYSPDQRAAMLKQMSTMSDAELKAQANEFNRLKKESQDRLKQMNLPADLLKNVPVGGHQLILDAIQKDGTLEKHKMVLEDALGADGYKTLVNKVNAALAAAQPAELPQDMVNKIPMKRREDVKKAYREGTPEERQQIINIINKLP